ncbi:MAG: hypothetical protein GF331_02255 [Chitinivibrionales bacterium]|nr:hypothetical protein [Chitinivibrionales bacterium]
MNLVSTVRYRLWRECLSRLRGKRCAAVKYDLGGVTDREGYVSVNLVGKPTIRANILELDTFCADATVDEFRLNHVYEHISVVDTPRFIADMVRKLKPGGRCRIVQTDAKKVLDMYQNDMLDFRALRDVIFTPYLRRKDFHFKGMDLNGHKYMWGVEELIEELVFYGFEQAEPFEAGSWSFDLEDYFPGDSMQRFHGARIPNLGVLARKSSQ